MRFHQIYEDQENYKEKELLRFFEVIHCLRDNVFFTDFEVFSQTNKLSQLKQ
jgi:hypothetical protein